MCYDFEATITMKFDALHKREVEDWIHDNVPLSGDYTVDVQPIEKTRDMKTMRQLCGLTNPIDENYIIHSGEDVLITMIKSEDGVFGTIYERPAADSEYQDEPWRNDYRIEVDGYEPSKGIIIKPVGENGITEEYMAAIVSAFMEQFKVI